MAQIPSGAYSSVSIVGECFLGEIKNTPNHRTNDVGPPSNGEAIAHPSLLQGRFLFSPLFVDGDGGAAKGETESRRRMKVAEDESK